MLIIEKIIKIKDFKDYGTINITDKRLKKHAGQKKTVKLEIIEKEE